MSAAPPLGRAWSSVREVAEGAELVFDLRSRLLGGSRGGVEVQHDVAPGIGQSECDSLADTVGGSGDQNGSA